MRVQGVDRHWICGGAAPLEKSDNPGFFCCPDFGRVRALEVANRKHFLVSWAYETLLAHTVDGLIFRNGKTKKGSDAEQRKYKKICLSVYRKK